MARHRVPTAGRAERLRIIGVLSAGEYRAIWAGQFLSTAGDQFARVALTVLVYERTRSPGWTAFTYAATYLPWLAGGLVLAGIADRFPRRTVLVACDLASCCLVAVMALPGMPLPAMVALLFLVTLLQAPFMAARSATYADILPADRYPAGVATAASTAQLATVSGFVCGGVFVAALGARPALAADAATFAASAAFVWRGVRARPAAAASAQGRPVITGVAMVFSHRALRAMVLFAWLAAFAYVPEALAVPYAARLGGGAAAAGLVFAAGPLGTAAGAMIFARLAHPVQTRWMAPMAVLSCLVLVLCLPRPGLAWSLVIFTVSGMLQAYQIAANARFVAAVPRERRGQAFGVAGAGMFSAAGIVFLLAGAVATAVAPSAAIAIFGAAGAVAAVVLAFSRGARLEPAVR